MNFHFTGGLPETECGYGSTLACTENLRAELPGLLSGLSIGRLLDAPCGDGLWMSRVDLSLVDYVGCDVEPRHLAKARAQTFRAMSTTFIELDIANNPLPQADAMLCRDFLQHLPNAATLNVLRKFVAGKIQWFLVTSHGNAVNDDIAEAGMFRPLNLMKPPFCFPEPRAAIEDPPGSGRTLAVWYRLDVMAAI